MPCNDGRDARRPVGRSRNPMRERRKGKEVITVLYPLTEIEPPQLVATESKDILATVGTIDLVLPLAATAAPFSYRNINSSSSLFLFLVIDKYLNIIPVLNSVYGYNLDRVYFSKGYLHITELVHKLR